MKRVIALALALCAPWPLAAQNAITQEGTVLQNSPMMFRGNNRARQGATVNGAPTGQTVTTGDSVVGGRCDYSAPIDDPAGYYRMCIDAKTGTLKLDGTKLPPFGTIKIEINGQVYEFPSSVTIVGSDAVVTSNAILKTVTGELGKRVVRLGFYTPGDGGLATYNWSATNCVGADDGAKVQPATTGCWIGDFSGQQPTPKIWGAKGDGATNDQPAVQAAINAMAGQTLYLGPHMYGLATGISCSSPMRIVGDGRSALDQQYSGFTALTTNMTLFTPCAQSYFGHFYIDMGHPGTNTAGTAISFPGNSGNSMIDFVWIDKPCIGLDLNGGAQAVNQLHVTGHRGAGCGGIRIGHSTSGGLTVDANISGVTLQSDLTNPADFGMRIEDAGGLFVTNTDILSSNVGTYITPGMGPGSQAQRVEWAYFNNTVLGDSTVYECLVIDVAHPVGIIRGLQFNQTWTSTSAAAGGIVLKNTGGTSIYSGIHFKGHRSYNNYGNGAEITMGDQVSFDNVHFCGNGKSGASSGIFWAANVGLGAVRNSTVGGQCDNNIGPPGVQYGVAYQGSNGGHILVGNELYGTIAPVYGTPTDSSVIANNQNLDTQTFTVASASTITLTTVAPSWTITGTTPIVNIAGGWNGRTVLFHGSSAVTFSAGGNLCTAYTLPQGRIVRATYLNGPNCWGFN